MKKVFASDFDGTLYFYKAADKDKLPSASVRKINEYQEDGNVFGLCTGRQVGGLTPFIKGHFEPDFYITSSGSNIVDRHLKKIYKRGIDQGAASQIVLFVKQRGNYHVTLDVDGEICVFTRIDFPGKYHLIKNIEDAPEGLLHQISVHTEDENDAQEIADKVNGLYGNYVHAFRNVVEVDIAPYGCSKGRGVEILRKHMGECRLYGIGDSMNDLPLLNAADFSYTFPYAPKALREKADMVVDTISEALEHSKNDK